MCAHLKLFAAAMIALGSTSIASAQNTATGSENQLNSAADRAADKTNRAADKTGTALDKTADEAADKTHDAARGASDSSPAGALDQSSRDTAQAPDAEGIRDVLASTTEAALKGQFSDVVERFADADRDRLGKAMPTKDQLKPLDQLTEQFRNDWKAKYNQEFDIEKEELVFNPSVRIIEGKVTGEARTASERSEVVTEEKAPGTSDDRSKLEKAADKTGEVVKETAEKTADVAREAADKVRGKSDKTATVIIPASHGLPQVSVPLVRELPEKWRIDVPDSLNADTLRSNLEKHLKMAQDDKANWPADANEGYLAVAHHILLGIFEGTPSVQTSSEAQPAGATITPSATPLTPGASQ
jgi:hypothetical protein